MGKNPMLAVPKESDINVNILSLAIPSASKEAVPDKVNKLLGKD